MSGRSFFERLLQRTPGYYILIVVVFAQLMSIPGAIMGTVSIQLNADFSPLQMSRIAWTTPVSILIGNLILLTVTWAMTSNARRRLVDLNRKEPASSNPAEVQTAWREISSFPWRYGIIALPLAFIVDIVPGSTYFYLQRLTNFDQYIYSLIGGFVSVLGVIILAVIIIEGMLTPARRALLPDDFETQIGSIAGARVGIKLLFITVALVLIGILLVAPIGYHQMVRATINIFDPASILRNLQIKRDLQIESIFVSALAVALNLGLVFAVSRSFTQPISSMITTFKEVEDGNLSKRAEVTATDEIGSLAIHFNRMISRLETLQNSLEEQVRARTEQLQAINEVGHAVSAILDPDELIEKVVNLITDRFGYYYAALFLLDPTGKWAELRSATGEAGRVLKESHHRLEVGGKSMVGSAVEKRVARIALDVGAESVRFDNPLLPYTRSEIALPLMVGETILGALDVQSTKQSAFDESDIETLQNMANQVAVALENAHLFQETRQRLQELQSSQRQYLQEAWTALGAEEYKEEYEVGDVAQTEKTVDIPLTLRDQIIGQISLAGDRKLSQEDQAWAEAVATQAAIALENARLLDQSQKTATYERLVAEITGKIWASNTVDGILQTSIRELGRALNVSEAVIELKTGDDANRS